MENINCSLIQVLVFSSLIVAVDPVAVGIVFILSLFCEISPSTFFELR